MKKTVEYSYPTSPNATKFGFGKTGCYCVKTIKENNPGVAVAAFATEQEAKKHAEALPFEWHWLYLKYN